MKEIWTKEKPEYHGDIIDFPQMITWPKPVQKPHLDYRWGRLPLRRPNRDLGVARMNVRLHPAKADEILPVLDRWAKLIPLLH